MPAADLTIALANLADAQDIYDIKMRAFAEEGRLSGSMDIPPLRETLAAVEHDIVTNTVLVARIEDRIVGSARGEVQESSCKIRAVCVDPDYQGRGIGAALLSAIEQTHPTVSEFVLTTNTLVPGNVAFYERHGYQVDSLTQYTDVIVLAHLSKPNRPTP